MTTATAQNAAANLFKGYQTVNFEDGTFTYFAERNGTIWQSAALPLTDRVAYSRFAQPVSVKWAVVDALPDGAEFIGNYPRYSGIR